MNRSEPVSQARAPRQDWSWLVAAALVVGVSVLSFLPGREKSLFHTKGRFHLLGHMLVFGSVAFFWIRGTRSPTLRMLFFVLTLLLGWGIEWGQHMVYAGEQLERADMLFDAVGVILGALLAL